MNGEGHTAILQVANVTKYFGRLAAVHEVNLSVMPGEIKSVIGPNGAGKSTLFNLITGMHVSTGQIRFRGLDITRVPKHRRARMGLVKADQMTSIFPSLLASENVALAIYAHDAGPRHLLAARARLAPFLERAGVVLRDVGLGEQAAQVAGELSHGDKKRLEIAMALATEPELLLLDEPTSGMSPHESAMMVELIKTIAAGRTILLIEHDIEIVLSISDSVAVLHRGMVLAQGRPAEIEQDKRVQDAYLGGYRR